MRHARKIAASDGIVDILPSCEKTDERAINFGRLK